MNFAQLFDRESEPLVFQSGELLFGEGDVVEQIYVVLQGEAEILVGDKVVEVVERGGLIGELSMVDRIPASASVRALSEVRVAVVDERRFKFLVQEHPTFAIEVMKLMAARLRRMDTRMESQS